MSKSNQLFHHIQIFWDVPVYLAIILKILFIYLKSEFISSKYAFKSHIWFYITILHLYFVILFISS